MEYREIFLTLLRKYDETKQPQSYLQDLVESTHLFLRMLERFSTGRKNLMVQVGYCWTCKEDSVSLDLVIDRHLNITEKYQSCSLLLYFTPVQLFIILKKITFQFNQLSW